MTIKTEIRKLEKVIRTIIEANKQLQTSFELITSVKGVGLIVASNLIVYTHNFTRFDD